MTSRRIPRMDYDCFELHTAINRRKCCEAFPPFDTNVIEISLHFGKASVLDRRGVNRAVPIGETKDNIYENRYDGCGCGGGTERRMILLLFLYALFIVFIERNAWTIWTRTRAR